jgi:hypothetical protein
LMPRKVSSVLDRPRSQTKQHIWKALPWHCPWPGPQKTKYTRTMLEPEKVGSATRSVLQIPD